MKFLIEHQKFILKVVGGLVTLVIISLILWAFQLNRNIQERISGSWFLPPVEIYSAPEQIFVGQRLKLSKFQSRLNHLKYRERRPDQKLRIGDYSLWDFNQCQNHSPVELPPEVVECLIFQTMDSNGEESVETQLIIIAFHKDDFVSALFAGQPPKPVDFVQLSAELFAQYYGEKPILRRLLKIGEIPLYCLQSVTAIEDSEFLMHKGVSPTGLARALLRNLVAGRYAQGGSTITQQLIKVYFLTSKKTLRRKFTEMFMAILLESQVSKDVILENYLNVIYMGQNGPFQVRGFGAAAEYYFDKRIENLDLAECSLLGAVLNSPGRYNPFTKVQNAIARREKVLQRMLDLNMISTDQMKVANNTPLPKKPPRILTEPAPYFVQAIRKKLENLSISSENGLRIFTSLNQEAQEVAQKSVIKALKQLESKNESIKKLKASGKDLQAALISLNLKTNDVIALVGGRGFKKTQYNRAIESHRQVGSVMKPFVYLAALESTQEDGSNYHPLSMVMDEKFEHKYEGQKWSPKNYDSKFHGAVPMFLSLKNSFNVSTARLGIDIGLTSIIDVAKRMGVTSKIEPLPSLTLGAFELYPWEVAQSYASIARFGQLMENRFIYRVEDLSGETIFEHETSPEQVVAPENAAVLIGMMKQTVLNGTARSLQWRGFTHPAAGKTGTTSDTRDAWFAGFTPHVLTVVWVGYDDNTNHGLTGASGALPIWAEFMRKYASRYPPTDFVWPENTSKYYLSADELNSMLVEPEEHIKEDIELIYIKGLEPKM